MNNTDKGYQELLDKILTKGKLKGDRTGTGTISIFTHNLEMDMADGFPLLTTKKMFTKGIIQELLWFLNGDTNIKYLVDNGVNIWNGDAYREYKKSMEHSVNETLTMDEFKEAIINNDKFADIHGDLGPIYGKQWISWVGYSNTAQGDISATGGMPYGYINQIQNAIDTLNDNPDSRRIMVSAWNVGEIDQMALPPCHWAFELYTEELTGKEMCEYVGVDYNEEVQKEWAKQNRYDTDAELKTILVDIYNAPTRRLSLKWHQRSVDTFLGLPFNIASYGFLLHMIAQQVNMVPGELVGDLTNVHIYKNHVDQCNEQKIRTPKTLPTLELTKAKDIFSYKIEDFKINNYEHLPAIKGNISV